jgi:hypothetical protein
MRKRKKSTKSFSALFSITFLFVSTFANALHSHHHEQITSSKYSCALIRQIPTLLDVSEKSKDYAGDCPACSYLLSSQVAYFNNVCLPEKQTSGRLSVSAPKVLHHDPFIENLARAPPYFPI